MTLEKNLFQRFIQLETSSSIVLFVTAISALLLANSPWHLLYEAFTTLHIGGVALNHGINDGLMVLFFLLVSLEIKRELIQGELNSLAKALLPFIAALGGICVPAAIFVAFNHSHPVYLQGWGIPTATDIAFSLGILSLLGKRVPHALKIFLMALAIIDDLGAIMIIAVFYNQQIIYSFLLLAVLCCLILCLLNYLNVQRTWLYVGIGIFLWWCMLQSGVHATIAGVVLGFLIPLRNKEKPHISLLKQMESRLHPWVSYGILPLFAFINAGLSLHDLHWQSMLHPLTCGIIVGLLLGKPLGVFIASWLAVKYKLARLPHAITWPQLFGVAILCGIGFTMSLFIGTLAFSFSHDSEISLVKLGVIVGSVLAGTLGYFTLRATARITRYNK